MTTNVKVLGVGELMLDVVVGVRNAVTVTVVVVPSATVVVDEVPSPPP